MNAKLIKTNQENNSQNNKKKMHKDDTQEYSSVHDIPIPSDLSPELKSEYVACQECLVRLENDWKFLKENGNEMEEEARQLLNQREEKRREKHEACMNLRIEVAARQREKELERIKNECEEAKKNLFERLICGYHHAYKCITSRLKDLMGKDYQAYIESNEIEFPQIHTEGQMKTRFQQPEEPKSKISSHETEQELLKIDSMFKDYMELVKMMNDTVNSQPAAESQNDANLQENVKND